MKNELIAIEKGYRISNDGQIINPKGVIINGFLNRRGYLSISLRLNGKYFKCDAHRIVAYQKYGSKLHEVGIEVRHKNGIKKDISFDNILTGTHAENMQDIPYEVRIRRSKHLLPFVKRKYNYDLIIDFYNKNQSYSETMKEFDISSRGTLYYILKSQNK
jgi:hypothetical protein